MVEDIATDLIKTMNAEDVVFDGDTNPPGGGFLLQGDGESFITQGDGTSLIIID